MKTNRMRIEELGARIEGGLQAWRASRVDPRSSLLAPRGLTLIELLVVIVILTTLVGGVIPVLSPNNDTRKIRAAARGLQTYINVVQAKVARTGRPQGIALRESSRGSGAALEVYGLEVPAKFAGLSADSRAAVQKLKEFDPGATVFKYWPDNITVGPLYPELEGRDLYVIDFRLAGLQGVGDVLPLRTLRYGDVIDVNGSLFKIVQHSSIRIDEVEDPANPGSKIYYVPDISDPMNAKEEYLHKLVAVWLNEFGQGIPQGEKTYKFERQPTLTADSPFQLPAGIVVDLQASVVEGSDNAPIEWRFPVRGGSLYVEPDKRPTDAVDTLGILFSPTGAVDRVLFNGVEFPSASRIVLMLGRIENAGIDSEQIDLGNRNEAPWAVQNGETIEGVQQRINWLNPDSRLLSIVTSSGRTVVSESAFVDPLLAKHQGDNDGESAELQIEAAHEFAHSMTTVGGN